DQGRVAAPAERVGMPDLALRIDQPAAAQVVDDVRVGLLDELSGELLHLEHEATPEVDRVAHGNTFLLAQAQVVNAVSRRRVYHAGAIVDGDEDGGDHDPGPLFGWLYDDEG